MKNLIILLGCLLIISGCAEEVTNPYKEFPNAYMPSSEGHTRIIFSDLPAVCTIKIYTLTGDLVRTIVESDGDGQAAWDVRNEGNEELPSGIYLYIIKSSTEGEEKGELVIRR